MFSLYMFKHNTYVGGLSIITIFHHYTHSYEMMMAVSSGNWDVIQPPHSLNGSTVTVVQVKDGRVTTRVTVVQVKDGRVASRVTVVQVKDGCVTTRVTVVQVKD